MPFPSTLSSFNRPTPTDRLNSPSHSALHNTVSSAVGQIEAVIGVEGSNSVVGTLEYLIKSPDSDGGGHVQTANKGGTGQISYSKGDMLVATSSSVLAKLAVSSTAGQALITDPTTATGLSYSNVVSNKITVRTSVVTYTQGASSVANVLFVASIAGSTIGTNNAIKFTGTIDAFATDNNNGNTIVLQYGQTSLAAITLSTNLTVPAAANMKGRIEGMIVGNGSGTDQKGFLNFSISNGGIGQAGGGSSSIIQAYNLGASSVNSFANQDLIITTKTGFNGSGTESIKGTIFVVEKVA